MGNASTSTQYSQHRNTDLQLGFDQLLDDASTVNEARAFQKKTSHLPRTMEDALPYFRDLIGQHHAAMLKADVMLTMKLRKEAHNLAIRLNGGTNLGIIADDDAPGCVLASKCAAQAGQVPLWGQKGVFIVDVHNMHIRVELDGIFGIGASMGFWPGFSAHIVQRDKPFFSETGYRSFLGLEVQPIAGLAPDAFVSKVLARHIETLPKRRRPRQ